MLIGVDLRGNRADRLGPAAQRGTNKHTQLANEETNKQADTNTAAKNKHTNKRTNERTNEQLGRRTNPHTCKQTNKHTSRHTHTNEQTNTHNQTHTTKQTHKQTHNAAADGGAGRLTQPFARGADSRLGRACLGDHDRVVVLPELLSELVEVRLQRLHAAPDNKFERGL